MDKKNLSNGAKLRFIFEGRLQSNFLGPRFRRQNKVKKHGGLIASLAISGESLVKENI